MSYIRLVAPAIFALLPSAGYAQERPAMGAHHEVVNVQPRHCLDKAKLTLVQFGAGQIQENGPFLFTGLGAGGSVVMYCFPNGNPNQTLFILVASSAPGPLALDLRDRMLRQFQANP